MLERVLKKLDQANRWGVRRAIKYETPHDNIATADLLHILRDKQGYRCCYCPHRIIKQFDLDHRIPMRMGGLHKLHNIQFACVWCNRSKNCNIRPPSIRPRPTDIDHTKPCPTSVWN